MKRIAIVSLDTKWWKDDFESTQACFYNLGVALLGTLCRQCGAQTLCLDCDVLEISEDEVVKRLREFRPDVLLFSELSMNFPRMIEVVRKIKEHQADCLVLVGDYAATFSPDLLTPYLYGVIDGIIPGDGEIPVQRIVSSIGTENCIEMIRHWTNCAINGEMTVCEEERLVMAALPIPERVTPVSPCTIMNIVASRGCGFNCSFCTRTRFSQFTGRGWEGREPKQIIEEMDYLNASFGIEDFFFFDDNFLGPPKYENYVRLLSFSEAVKSRNYHFRISCRADAFEGKFHVLKALASAGLYRLFIGVESGSASQLLRFNKKIHPEQIVENFLRYKELGLAIHIGFIAFDHKTTPEEYAESTKLLQQIDHAHFFRNYVSRLFIEPGMDFPKEEVGKGVYPGWITPEIETFFTSSQELLRPIDCWFEKYEIAQAKNAPSWGEDLFYSELKEHATSAYLSLARQLISRDFECVSQLSTYTSLLDRFNKKAIQ